MEEAASRCARLPESPESTGPVNEQLPVLLLHGLWGGADSWRSYSQHLREGGWNEGPVLEFADNATWPAATSALVSDYSANGITGTTVTPTSQAILPGRSFFRVVFQNNDGQSFEMQGKQVAAAIAAVRDKTRSEKVILIGHSMGGLAVRAYLQSKSYQHDVYAVATVATPHMGSLLPYLAYEANASGCRNLAWLLGKSLNAPAVKALAPDSSEMVALNTAAVPYGRLPEGIQWLNIVAEFDPPAEASSIADHKGYLALWQRDLTRYFDPSAAQSIADGAVLGNWTDGIVPAWSQVVSGIPVGASARVKIAVVRSHHTDVTDSADAWRYLDAFLAPVTSVAGSLPSASP